MRYIIVTSDYVIDSSDGRMLTLGELESVLLEKPGGVIVGNNLYPRLAKLVPMVKSDYGWSAKLHLQQKRKPKSGRVGGVIYFTNFCYRFPKERIAKNKRFRPGSVKWIVLNLELFSETEDSDLLDAAESLVDLAEKRGITPRYSPGAFGGAMLRASSNWPKQRSPAPWFISDKARNYLPGNYYALKSGYQFRVVKSAYYLDQKSSHHTIASEIRLPHPSKLRARGYLRAIESGRHPNWIDNMVEIQDHVGMVCAKVECDVLPPLQEHLYPPWAKVPGTRVVWIWTPDLRLLDHRVRVQWISASLTSVKDDIALHEYANWCLGVLTENKNPVVKPAMLAAYGLLGVRSDSEMQQHSVTGRPKPPRADIVQLPLVGECYRSTVKNVRVPVIQNVVARGVIEAETRARSIELARDLESKGITVSQIYADGLIANTDTLPFLPPGWRIAGALTDVRSPSANTIISREMVRMPGVPGGRRALRIEQTSRALDMA